MGPPGAGGDAGYAAYVMPTWVAGAVAATFSPRSANPEPEQSACSGLGRTSGSSDGAEPKARFAAGDPPAARNPLDTVRRADGIESAAVGVPT